MKNALESFVASMKHYVEVDPSIWPELKKTKMVSCGSSLHVAEETYIYEGNTYVCYWDISEDPKLPPFLIEMLIKE